MIYCKYFFLLNFFLNFISIFQQTKVNSNILDFEIFYFLHSYEGTGRSLSLKLLQQLREQAQITGSTSDKNTAASTGRSLQEVLFDRRIFIIF